MKFICKNNNNEKQIKSFISHLVSQNKKYNVHQSDTTHKVAFCVEYKGKDKLFIEWFDSIRNANQNANLDNDNRDKNLCIGIVQTTKNACNRPVKCGNFT